jgi:hypothetical protein
VYTLAPYRFGFEWNARHENASSECGRLTPQEIFSSREERRGTSGSPLQGRRGPPGNVLLRVRFLVVYPGFGVLGKLSDRGGERVFDEVDEGHGL